MPTRVLGAVHGDDPDTRSWAEKRADEEAALGHTTQPYALVVGGGQGGIALGARLRQLGVPADRRRQARATGRPVAQALQVAVPARPGLVRPPAVHAVPAELAGVRAQGQDRRLAGVLHQGHGGPVLVEDHLPVGVIRRGREAAGPSSWTGTASGSRCTRRSWSWPPACRASRACRRCRGAGRLPGDQHHSSAHPGPDRYVGKRAVVIGSNNSAHDICKALYENGVDVTMVQRSSTHIVRSDSLMDLGLGDLYSERAVASGMTTEKADLTFASLPYRIMHEFQIPIYNAIRERDKDFYERLAAAGFELDWGDDESGLFMKYLRRGSGYYIDVGACDLVADGRIKLAHGQVDRLTEDSVVLADGTELPADLVVYATGYGSMNGWAADLIGQDVADKVGKVWGLGSDTTKDPGPWEGEQRNMWKPTQQDEPVVPRRQPASVAALLAVSGVADQGAPRGAAHPGLRPRRGAPPELIAASTATMAGVDDTRICGSRTSPATTRWTGCASTTSPPSPSSAATGSSRCAPRRWRCSTPTPASRTCGAAASICTTSGGTRPTRAGCGGARRWRATGPNSRSGTSSSTSMRSPTPMTRTGCGRAPTSSSPTSPWP